MSKDLEVTIPDLKVRIRQNAWERIHGLCMAADTEVSGLGMVSRKGNTFTIYDSFFPIQEGTAGHTELEPASIADTMMRIHRSGRPLEHMRFWWHTHNDFACFWSGTDDATAERLAGTNKEWMLSLVTNKKNTYCARLDLFSPVKMSIQDITIEWIPGKKLYRTNWEYQVKQKVKERPLPQITYVNHYLAQDYSKKDKKEWKYDKSDNKLFGGYSPAFETREELRTLWDRQDFGWVWDKDKKQLVELNKYATRDNNGNGSNGNDSGRCGKNKYEVPQSIGSGGDGPTLYD